MRTILFFASALLLATGCGTLAQTPEEKRAEEKLVRQRLDERAYVIDIDYMIPQRGAGKFVGGAYSITVDGDVINSHLPYSGVAYNVPYGGGKVLTFKDDIDEYTDSGFQGNSRVIVLKTDNDEDIIVYTITVYADGKASVHVRCRNREAINYRGVLNADKDVRKEETE